MITHPRSKLVHAGPGMAAVWGLCIAAILCGCSPSGGGGNGGTPSNTNANDADLGDAEVTVPETGDTLLTIEEEGEAGSASYDGTDGEADDDVAVTGFTADTGDESFAATFDEQGQPTGATMGTMEVTFTTNPDGTVDYQVTEDGEVVFSGSGISVDESTAKGMFRAARGYSREDIADCAFYIPMDFLPRNLILEGLDCVQSGPELISMCMMLCVMDKVLLPRLQVSRLCIQTCLGAIFEEECRSRCYARMARAEEEVYRYRTYIWCTAQDMAAQIANYYVQNGRCPDEDDNANANDNGGGDNENANDNSGGQDNGNDNSGQGGDFAITSVSYDSNIPSGGDYGGLDVYWSGDPVFPVEVELRQPDGCPSEFTCDAHGATFAEEQNPLVCRECYGCSGLSGWGPMFSYEVVLVDARGVESEPYRIILICQLP